VLTAPDDEAAARDHTRPNHYSTVVPLASSIHGVIIDWPASFGDALDRLETRAAAGDEVARLQLDRLIVELRMLERLDAEPAEDSAGLKRVRQSGRHLVWRLSHPFHPRVAVRLIVWFPPEQRDRVVVALFAGDKATMGDVFYDSVAVRADTTIEQWKYQQRSDKREDT